jgi:hypothetical protein
VLIQGANKTPGGWHKNEARPESGGGWGTFLDCLGRVSFCPPSYYEGGGARTAKNHSNSDIPGSHTLVKQRKKPGVTSDTSDTSHSDACKNRNHKTSPNSYIFHTNLTMFSAFLHNYDVLLKKTQK